MQKCPENAEGQIRDESCYTCFMLDLKTPPNLHLFPDKATLVYKGGGRPFREENRCQHYSNGSCDLTS